MKEMKSWRTEMNNYGWICVRCSKSNAPHVNSCDCSPVQQAIPYYPYAPILPYNPYPPNPYTIPYNPYPWDYTITISPIPVATTTLSQPQFDYTQSAVLTDLCENTHQTQYQNQF